MVKMQSRVAELRAEDPPRMRWSDIFEGGEDELTPAQAVVLDDYLFHFMVGPLDEGDKEVCPCCRERIGGLCGLLGMGVSLEWGIAHGEAFCSGCGWPYRVYHYDIGGKGEDALIKRLVVGLPYHPSEIRLKGDAPE